MFGVLKPFKWHFGQLFSYKKGVGAFIRENTLYISLLHYTGIIATSRWIQFQLPISGVFLTGIPSKCVSVWRSWIICATHKKNMSCQVCCRFEPNSDYIWERHVLKLHADGQVVFSKIFNFLHHLPDGIGSKWVKWYWGTYMIFFYNLRMLPI